MDRRIFIKTVAGWVLSLVAGEWLAGETLVWGQAPSTSRRTTRIALVKTADRATGIKRALRLLEVNPVRNKQVLLKPNFNTADPFPASTHNDTLIHLIAELKEMGAKTITIGERSGPPDTADVLKEKGIYDLCRRLNVGLLNFEELSPAEWVKVSPPHNHWHDGFLMAKPVLDSDCVVTTCCLKTHRFGGVFSMSLKLSVGNVHKMNMRELHTSLLSQRKMIAEVNQAYAPALILLDGIEAFVDKGPMTGPKKRGDVILAGTDRVAIDAVGLAILKELGSNKEIMGKSIFAQEQISRAVEVGLGVRNAGEIEIVTDDQAGRSYAEKLRLILAKG
jgi:uncharacterized protein (DUF362 family)